MFVLPSVLPYCHCVCNAQLEHDEIRKSGKSSAEAFESKIRKSKHHNKTARAKKQEEALQMLVFEQAAQGTRKSGGQQPNYESQYLQQPTYESQYLQQPTYESQYLQQPSGTYESQYLQQPADEYNRKSGEMPVQPALPLPTEKMLWNLYMNEPKVAEPKMVEPYMNEPKVGEPKVAEPKVAEPKVRKSQRKSQQ